MLFPRSCKKPKLFMKFFCRYLSNKSRITLPYSEKVIVLNSQYNDPYLNLAYENFMYENLNLESHDVLYFWQNSPCVVIGRHQNPWLECDLRYLKEHGIKLARRYSGGGTVYHDLGNLNITFMTSRARYNRKRNLECIAKALSDRWNLDVDLSPRDDVVVDGIFKISGSAAKLGKYSSYHHCTLLCDVDLDRLNRAIMPRMVATSRATQSVSSHVINLKDIEPSLNVNEIITSVARTYMQENQHPKILSMDIFRKNFTEIHKIKNELLTWEWIFGKTSPFTITKSSLLPSGTKVKVDLDIQSGRINNMAILPSFVFENEISKHLRGIRFESDVVSKAIGLCLEKCAGFQDHTMEKDFRDILQNISKIA